MRLTAMAPAGLIGALVLVAGCRERVVSPPPERITAEAEVPVAELNVALPIAISLDELQRLLNAGVPTTLYSINQTERDCVPPVRIRGRRISPAIGCTIVGSARRGQIRLSGNGNRLQMHMPVSAEVQARNVGRVLSKTATGAAEVRADIQLGMTPDWQPTARVVIDYDWTKAPGINVLGRRVTFTGRADRELAKVIAGIERDIPRHLTALHVRRHLELAWNDGFTTIELNAKNPPVWMRLTPRQLSYGGYAVSGRRLDLRLGLDAGVETFIGDRPPNPVPIPLPPSGKIKGPDGFHVNAPVIAAYAKLEPVLEDALNKLAAEPIDVPAAGKIDVDFGAPTIYATHGGRLAIGLPIKASVRRFNLPTRGVVWLTGIPYNAPNSPVIKVRDLQITGSTDRRSADMLMQIAMSPAVVASIEGALSQNFANDLEKLRGKIDKALTEKQVGDFVLGVQITGLNYGVVMPLGQGAYLPVQLHGEGSLRWSQKAGQAARQAKQAQAKQTPKK